MNFQLINNQSWQPSTVTTSTFVVPTYGFAMRDAVSLPCHLSAGMTAKKRHAAAIKATVEGPQPWSPPVT